MKVANALIVNDKNEFLLQKKSSGHKVIPYMWTLFGGVIEDELTEQAVIREVEEEIGITLDNPKFLFEHDFEVSGINIKAYIFYIKFDGSMSKIRLNEGNGVAFFSVDELKRNAVHFATKDIINKFLRNQN